jgi:hypothetical protein
MSARPCRIWCQPVPCRNGCAALRLPGTNAAGWVGQAKGDIRSQLSCATKLRRSRTCGDPGGPCRAGGRLQNA